MSADRTRRLHEATKHHPGRLGGGGRMDPTNRPAPWKRYPQASEVVLPRRFPESTVPATAVLSGTASPPAGDLDLDALARLLFFSAGVTRPWDVGGQTLHFRAAPSAGALYPIELYAACAELPGLPAGLYHFEPIGHLLQPLRDRDVRAAVADAAAWPDAAAAPCTLLLTGIPWRTAWKYGLRGYRHLFWDAGTVVAHVLALAAAAGLPATVLTGFDDGALTRLLGLEGETAATGGELPLAVIPLGRAAAPANHDSIPEPLHLDVGPLSRAPQTDDAMRAVHEEASLSGAEQISAWRAAARAAARPAGTPSAPPETVEPIEAVILRRGSTRRFARSAVAEEARAWPLGVATSGVATSPAAGTGVATLPAAVDALPDRGTLLDHHVAVHAVEGLPGGAFRWETDGPVRVGDLDRSVTAHLCLDQPHGGDAAYTTFHGADLDALLDSVGPRGYRVAQLEAGIVSGRLQLAVFAAGAGATGLTFYDEEVRRCFETRSEPMTVTAVGHPAYRPRTGARP